MERIPRAAIADLILNDTKPVRDEFLAHFPDRTDQFVNSLLRISDRLADLEGRLPDTQRAKYVWFFLFGALNWLTISYKLLINGLLVPSGNLMRNWSESLSMGLLCCDPRTRSFEKYIANPRRFPVHNAPDNVLKESNRRILLIDKKGWHTFQKINKVYNEYSHASALSYATLFKFDTPGGLILGAEFDAQKSKAYEKELALRISACILFLNTIAIVERHLLTDNVLSSDAQNSK